MNAMLLEARISVDYASKKGALRDAALEIACGETLGLIGESGSGKSTLALSIMRLVESRGRLVFDGRDLMKLGKAEMRSLRGRDIAMAPQSAIASLNPALRIGSQMAEAWRAHRQRDGRSWRERSLAAFEMVALADGGALLQRYPRQLSVGQAQRALIAMAILHRPRLLIADEPTSALDPITASEILALFKRLNRELNMAILFISHDLLSVASLCNRISILRNGEIVESGAAEQIFRHPSHAYTRALLDAVPQPLLPQEATSDLIALSGFGQQHVPLESSTALPALLK